jgi:hypothetical protein
VKRALRERLADAATVGLTVARIAYGGRHVRITVADAAGREATISVSHSPSNRWTKQRFRADLRRFMRLEAAPPHATEWGAVTSRAPTTMTSFPQGQAADETARRKSSHG